MKMTTEIQTLFDDVPVALDALRLAPGVSMILNLDQRRFEFAPGEWNRLLDLARAGYEAELLRT